MPENRLKDNRSMLDAAEDALRELCEPVSPPKRTLDYRNYFCARNLDNTEVVSKNEPRRAALYAAVAEYGRAYSHIAHELAAAGYSPREAAGIQKEVAYFQELQGELQRASGDEVAEESAPR
ncbi:hypothetical protein E3O11_01700 [Cryobacterium levicorallinum]|uniref:Type I restriction enzyme, R subunit n=1 Tax=Cryobacterium levicorallinum TaxID=995038 RepID=A0A1I3BCG5_9MICO|nr:hypothetical protein [Cryobacterium levicorallinum]TFB88933.1 hypothetical protein E3O11_01700 [Cryobacterium levicorallinum]GEP28109.1 hypothetical protein CLE01_27070 [Cryobacterium levicorallinum]SFH59786.1 type I restriction enzyme, R subunit [Cryobacterium levicorallinum]